MTTASRHVHRHGLRLRPDLYDDQPPLTTRAAARAYERYLAQLLELRGYSVLGGH